MDALPAYGLGLNAVALCRGRRIIGTQYHVEVEVPGYFIRQVRRHEDSVYGLELETHIV